MSQIASNSVPGNKSLSILIFILIFSNVARLTLGIPAATEFPSQFNNVKEIVQPETSSYWGLGLGDVISYGVQSVQSMIKYVIGVEDRPREFYVVHIKDEKNPENSKDVLRERGREGKDDDIPLKGGKLPGNSLIVNAENPVTEYVSSPEKTITPATNNEPNKQTPDTSGKSQNGKGTSTTPTTNDERNNSPVPNPLPSENKETMPPSSSADIQNLPQKKDDEKVTHPNHESKIGTPEQQVPKITKSENAQLDQEGNSKAVHDHSQINSPPTAQNSNPQSTSEVNSLNGDVSKSAQNQGETLISNHHASPAGKLAAFEAETVSQPPSQEGPSKQVETESQNLGNLLPMNVESAALTLPIKKETQSSDNNSSSDPYQILYSNHTIDNEVTPPQIPIPSTSQHTNSHQSSMENQESDIEPKILEPLANQTTKKDTRKDDEFPGHRHEGSPNGDHNLGPSLLKIEKTQPPIPVKEDSHVPEPTQHEIQELPSSDPAEPMSTDACEMEYAKELCEKTPLICEQFQTDEEFDDYIKENSGCVAEGQEQVPPSTKEPDELAEPHYDPNEFITVNECEIEFEKELCQREPDTCERFQTNEDFIAYVKENSGCEAGGQQEPPTDDPDRLIEPSSFDPDGLISLNECETEFERELCNSKPDICHEFQSAEEFISYVKENSGCEAGGQDYGERQSLAHDVDEDPSHQENRSHDSQSPENSDGQGVPDYDNDALPSPQFKPAASPEKKKSGTKKKTKSSKEKRSKST